MSDAGETAGDLLSVDLFRLFNSEASCVWKRKINTLGVKLSTPAVLSDARLRSRLRCDKGVFGMSELPVGDKATFFPGLLQLAGILPLHIPQWGLGRGTCLACRACVLVPLLNSRLVRHVPGV